MADIRITPAATPKDVVSYGLDRRRSPFVQNFIAPPIARPRRKSVANIRLAAAQRQGISLFPRGRTAPNRARQVELDAGNRPPGTGGRRNS